MLSRWRLGLFTSEPTFDATHPVKDYPAERRGDQGAPNRPEADGDADGRRQPDARGRRQSFDLMFLAQLEDGSPSEEADPGHDALNDATQIIARKTELGGHNDKEGTS